MLITKTIKPTTTSRTHLSVLRGLSLTSTESRSAMYTVSVLTATRSCTSLIRSRTDVRVRSVSCAIRTVSPASFSRMVTIVTSTIVSCTATAIRSVRRQSLCSVRPVLTCSLVARRLVPQPASSSDRATAARGITSRRRQFCPDRAVAAKRTVVNLLYSIAQ